MSIEVMNMVWEMRPDAVTPPQRLVLLCLADHATPDGRNCFPSVRRQVQRTSLAERTVQLSLRALEDQTLIISERIYRKAKQYRINLEELRRRRYSNTDSAPDAETNTNDSARHAESRQCVSAIGAPLSAPSAENSAPHAPDSASAAPDPSMIRPKEPPMKQRRRHAAHAACDERRVWCVPSALHNELSDRLSPRFDGNRELAALKLQEWYRQVWECLDADFTMGDPWKFWKVQFGEVFGDEMTMAERIRLYSLRRPAATT